MELKIKIKSMQVNLSKLDKGSVCVNFLKIVCLLIVVLFGTVFSVNAEPPEELIDRIVVAQKRFEQARNVLRSKNPKMFYDFDTNKWTNECYAAEEAFRKYYHSEYREYITAKMELDDLFYTFYVAKVNRSSK